MSKEPPPPYSGPPPPGFMPPPPTAGVYYPELPPQMGPPMPPSQNQPPGVRGGGVYVQSVTFTPLGPYSQELVCPSCHAHIKSTVQVEPNTKTHIFALILCLLQCYLCCCIPYCIDSCQSKNHYCPQCNAFLGTYDN